MSLLGFKREGNMGVIVPENKEVAKLKGLHLYHFGLSQCSQRVRICLEEKGLPWVSHHLNLGKLL